MTVESVPFFDYSRLHLVDYPQYGAALTDVLERSDFIMRGDLLTFEDNLGKYLGVNHVVGVGNGTDAIWFCLLAAGIKPGDEVILPSHTYVATADAVKFIGGVPVLIDCQDDHLISPAAIEEAITHKTRAVIAVNLNGRACQLDLIREIATRHELVMIEDNAQGLGAKLDGQPAGTFGHSGTLSFFPAKNLGCIGDGGAVITNSKEVAEKIFLLRNHGRDASGEVVTWGLNSRLDNLQAAVLNAKLVHLDESLEKRRSLARIYCEGLAEFQFIKLPNGPEFSARHFDSYQNFEIEVDSRDNFREYLGKNGVGTSLPWSGKAVHHFNLPGTIVKDVTNTDRLFKKILLLPLNQYMHESEAEFVVTKVRSYCAANGLK